MAFRHLRTRWHLLPTTNESVRLVGGFSLLFFPLTALYNQERVFLTRSSSLPPSTTKNESFWLVLPPPHPLQPRTSLFDSFLILSTIYHKERVILTRSFVLATIHHQERVFLTNSPPFTTKNKSFWLVLRPHHPLQPRTSLFDSFSVLANLYHQEWVIFDLFFVLFIIIILILYLNFLVFLFPIQGYCEIVLY